MTIKRRVGFVLAVALFVCVTWFFGWWGIPLLALLAGFSWVGVRPMFIALQAVIAWIALLAFDATHAGFMSLATVLGGVMTLPWLVVVLVALLLAFALAWGAATVGAQLRAVRS